MIRLLFSWLHTRKNRQNYPEKMKKLIILPSLSRFWGSVVSLSSTCSISIWENKSINIAKTNQIDCQKHNIPLLASFWRTCPNSFSVCIFCNKKRYCIYLKHINKERTYIPLWSIIMDSWLFNSDTSIS